MDERGGGLDKDPSITQTASETVVSAPGDSSLLNTPDSSLVNPDVIPVVSNRFGRRSLLEGLIGVGLGITAAVVPVSEKHIPSFANETLLGRLLHRFLGTRVTRAEGGEETTTTTAVLSETAVNPDNVGDNASAAPAGGEPDTTLPPEAVPSAELRQPPYEYHWVDPSGQFTVDVINLPGSKNLITMDLDKPAKKQDPNNPNQLIDDPDKTVGQVLVEKFRKYGYTGYRLEWDDSLGERQNGTSEYHTGRPPNLGELFSLHKWVINDPDNPGIIVGKFKFTNTATPLSERNGGLANFRRVINQDLAIALYTGTKPPPYMRSSKNINDPELRDMISEFNRIITPFDVILG